jgi:hypothetical protein
MEYDQMSYDDLKDHINKVLTVEYNEKMDEAYNHTGPNGEPDVRGFMEKVEAASEKISEARTILTLKTPMDKIKMSTQGKYGDLIPLEDFIAYCESGCFIDYDGFGNYATETEESNLTISPSAVRKGQFRKDFTHVMWYNK